MLEANAPRATAASGLRKWAWTALAAAVLTVAGAGVASARCPASNMLGTGMISNVCWSCIFPIKVAGITIFSPTQAAGGTDANGFTLSSRPEAPERAADRPFCLCDTGPLPTAGIPVGMWMPANLYETTFEPGCSSTLGGIEMGITDPLFLGTSGDPTSDLEQQSFNHVHVYSYPVVLMMELFTRCRRGMADIDVLYMSEIDPLWNDPIVALFGNPMSVFGSSVAASAACAADSISSSVGRPIDSLFWCGGTWTTTMAPYTGFEHAQGPVQFSSSTAQKLLAMNVARGITRNMVGNDAVCQATFEPMVKRSHYRWQSAWPAAEGRRNHASGETPLRWGAGRVIPGVADMPIYLQWQWVDCCSTIIGG